MYKYQVATTVYHSETDAPVEVEITFTYSEPDMSDFEVTCIEPVMNTEAVMASLAEHTGESLQEMYEQGYELSLSHADDFWYNEDTLWEEIKEV